MKKKIKGLLIFVSVPDIKTAKKIIDAVLPKRLAASVNIVSKEDSFYWWKNKICKAKELLLTIKTSSDNFRKIEKAVKSVHPYEVPEIISIDISNASEDYFLWIKEYAKT
ncbi:MAG: divalent-cation tolerance protein CutA [Elusimicrobiota bacterium]|jgi:periplasmic divalent cation tolerance protein|nr:divalent-cation tolerance protein CutA [Elusimicrobiota bacterium]